MYLNPCRTTPGNQYADRSPTADSDKQASRATRGVGYSLTRLLARWATSEPGYSLTRLLTNRTTR